MKNIITLETIKASLEKAKFITNLLKKGVALEDAVAEYKSQK